tara:strand:+ start:1188 stop:1637 length:450 start_codon:yes stop_codon:yes gene_type:complete
MVNFQSAIDRLQATYPVVRLVSTSYLGVESGDIVVVNYPRTDEVTGARTPLQRIGFIMSSSRTDGDGGLRISSRLNQILNFVDAAEISDDEFVDIVDKLYNEELEPIVSQFRYQYGGDINGVTIMDKFKTFKILELSGTSIIRIEVDNG